MTAKYDETVILGGSRTPFGAYGGSLAALNPTDLAVEAAKSALDKAAIEKSLVDHIVLGNVIHSSPDSIYMARHVAYRAGLDKNTPGLMVNLLCGSAIASIVQADLILGAGQAKAVLAGGTEALSMTPYSSWNIRWGKRMGHGDLLDGLDIRDTLVNFSMGETAENLQEKYGPISRDQQDEYAELSQARYKEALDKGYIANEIIPVEIKSKKEIKLIIADEHPRPGTTREALSKLRPAFKSDGTVTAGNACGIVDGAACVVLTKASLAAKENLKPLARIVSSATVGVPPEIMGIGPVDAIPAALAKAGLKMSDIDLFEINEAFALQYLACEKALGLNREIVNVNGGSIAVGHPFGATGARITMTLVHELIRRQKKYGCVSLCVGSGMGIAMVIDNLA